MVFKKIKKDKIIIILQVILYGIGYLIPLSLDT